MASPGPRSNVDIPEVRRVVIVADVDNPDVPAVRWGSRTAHALGVEAMVIAPDEFASAERSPDRAADEVAITARDTARLAAGSGSEVDDVQVVIDDERDAVDDAVVAMTDEHDVVVIGTEDVVGLTSLALGAEAHSLAHKLGCPLVAVPSSSVPGAGPILVGLSGSDEEARSLAWAVALGSALERPVVALHAVNPLYDSFDNAGDLGDHDARAKRLAHAAGVEFVDRFDTPDHLCRRAVADLDACLLVVATKHHWSLGGRMLGRVTDGLLHEPPCPLAILPHGYVRN